MLNIKYELGLPLQTQPVRDLRVVLGTEPDGPEVTLDLSKLLAGRLLIQGPSGAGKSTLLRRLISQCVQHLRFLLVDPEGEHALLGTLPLHHRTELRAASMSGVLDISDMNREAQLVYLTGLIHNLIEVPRELWSEHYLVIIDEVEIFTPTDCSAFEDPSVGKRSRSALIDLMSRGRKRGLVACIATHRLAQLAASVRAEARNLLIGGSSFDVDIHRAADALGWTAKKAFAIIPHLPVGHFVASGPAFNKSPVIVRIPAP